MINIPLLVVFAILGIGLGVGYNFLIIKKYPDDRRKGGYVATVIIFFLTTVVLFSVISVKKYTDKAVPEKANEIVEKIKKEHSNVGFVKNGLNLTGINDNVSRLNSVVSDLPKVLPSSSELGLAPGLYNFLMGIAMKELQKKLTLAGNVENSAASFADENNYLTVSSIKDNLQKRVLKILHIIMFILAAIFVIIFLIHIIKSLIIFSKEKKASA